MRDRENAAGFLRRNGFENPSEGPIDAIADVMHDANPRCGYLRPGEWQCNCKPKPGPCRAITAAKAELDS